jgi:alkanesulfonate monooxygenase SsuD/methylene tetrahydromethanopterin reductase-like flavin-dependent oxidoreductase (luciferase family)
LARARRPAPAIVSQRNVERDKPGHLFLKKDPENLQLGDCDRLYADKLGLLLAINENEQVSWESPFRSPLKDALVAPRPETPIPIWLGTGGNPGSTVRAGQSGLPVSYGILSGTPQH